MSESLDRQNLWSEVREIRNTTGLSLREANDARIRFGSAKAAIEALAVPKARDAYESEYDRLRRTNRELLEALEADANEMEVAAGVMWSRADGIENLHKLAAQALRNSAEKMRYRAEQARAAIARVNGYAS